MSRFYNLKIGKPAINGCAIKVDMQASRNERLEEIADGEDSFKFIRLAGKREIYEMSSPNVTFPRGMGADALGGEIGVPVRVEGSRPDLVMLAVSPDGGLKLHGRQKKRCYLSEITEKKADEMKEFARCWRLQRMYIYE